ncbi:hypothetical protein Esi_0115_0058 [Ectocarpus siliculosus]|uniref:Uncharacterized protein n=1 Tax=Ectocarpus siliculosus TaxID=2880 RepID=D7FHZ9_ECTSI|nr:hypothetical protein Esi_0115_0058 [Ectocarpus siliculosus]|eukprot:CBJ49010.1 hypothetical protein Esi_0115_0058 [Ectocarpus siliculosus]
MNEGTGRVSQGYWGTHLTSEAADASETIAAPRTASGGRRRGTVLENELAKEGRRKAGGTAAAVASVEQMEAAEALMRAHSEGKMVPVWQVLDAADVSQKLGRDDDCVHYFTTSSPVRKGASSQGGVGVFATQPFEEQEVVMAFRRHCSPVSKRLAARLLLGLNGYVVHDGGDPIYLDISTFGFPARVMNNSDKPHVFVCTVTAGFSLEKYVFVFPLKSIFGGRGTLLPAREGWHEPVTGL